MEASWLAEVDWLGIFSDVLVPVAAIAISTIVAVRVSTASARAAVRLAAQERQDARASLRRERLLTAASPLFDDLAQLISIDMHSEDMRPVTRSMRAHIATFRAALDPSDSLVFDWISLRHREGLYLWGKALGDSPPPSLGPPFHLVAGGDRPATAKARKWAHETLLQIQGWLSGDVHREWFLEDGQRIIGLTAVMADAAEAAKGS